MQNGLVFFVFMTMGYDCFAQCAFPSTLKTNDSLCLGTDTLFVSSPGGFINSITWYNGKTVDTTVSASIAPVYITVAGGNGSGAAANQLQYPLGIFVDAGGALYVADAENDRILKFPPGSSNATQGITVAGGNGAGPAANQLSGPDALFVDQSGNLYVADTYNSRIQRFPPGSGSATPGITIAGGNGNGSAANQFEPTGVFVDGFGNLYVTDYLNSRILEFPPGSTGATNGITVAGGNGQGSAANQLEGPYSAIVDGSGNIYVADLSNNRVQKFPSGSTSATNGITVAGGNGFGTAANQLEDPSCVFLDNSGNLYVDDMQNTRIQKFPPGSTSATNGITIACGFGQGTSPNQFIGSYGVFLSGSGDIYFSDIANDRVQELKPVGSIDTFFVPGVPGSYTAVITGPSGCTDTTNAIVINAPATPVLTIAANSTAECAGDIALFTASEVNGGAAPTYQWQVNGNNTGTNSDTLITSSLRNGDRVSCLLTSSIACTSPVPAADPIIMTVYPLPVVRLSPDTVIIKGGGNTVLNPMVSGTIAACLWTPASGLDNAAILSPVADPGITTTYDLTVTDNNGCQASGKETVFVYYPLEMPNAFTPNGDGKNDVFRIPLSTPQFIKAFRVFDRWGMRVFETANSALGWDGTYAGHPQPPGTYVWQIQYQDALTGKSVFASGTVILVR